MTDRIRKGWLLRRIAELVVYVGLLLFLVDQYVEPAILNSLTPLRESRPILVVERVLKLSLPCMYVWLTIFYVFFHLFLNVVRIPSMLASLLACTCTCQASKTESGTRAGRRTSLLCRPRILQGLVERQHNW